MSAEGGQQKDLFERLRMLMATRIQAPAASGPHLESPPQFYVLQTRNTLENYMMGLPMNEDLTGAEQEKSIPCSPPPILTPSPLQAFTPL